MKGNIQRDAELPGWFLQQFGTANLYLIVGPAVGPTCELLVLTLNPLLHFLSNRFHVVLMPFCFVTITHHSRHRSNFSPSRMFLYSPLVKMRTSRYILKPVFFYSSFQSQVR